MKIYLWRDLETKRPTAELVACGIYTFDLYVRIECSKFDTIN